MNMMDMKGYSNYGNIIRLSPSDIKELVGVPQHFLLGSKIADSRRLQICGVLSVWAEIYKRNFIIREKWKLQYISRGEPRKSDAWKVLWIWDI